MTPCRVIKRAESAESAESALKVGAARPAAATQMHKKHNPAYPLSESKSKTTVDSTRLGSALGRAAVGTRANGSLIQRNKVYQTGNTRTTTTHSYTCLKEEPAKSPAIGSSECCQRAVASGLVAKRTAAACSIDSVGLDEILCVATATASTPRPGMARCRRRSASHSASISPSRYSG